MKASTFVCCMGVLAASMLAYTYATVGGQYSVNVHFVPPLVTSTCQIAQFWSPPNVTCALCFCMTGSLSRCIPQPGCNPQNTTTTTANPNNSTASTTLPTTSGNSDNPQTTAAADPSGTSSTAAPAPAGPSGTEAPTEPPAKRAAKPVKARRRRHANQS